MTSMKDLRDLANKADVYFTAWSNGKRLTYRIWEGRAPRSYFEGGHIHSTYRKELEMFLHILIAEKIEAQRDWIKAL